MLDVLRMNLFEKFNIKEWYEKNGSGEKHPTIWENEIACDFYCTHCESEKTFITRNKNDVRQALIIHPHNNNGLQYTLVNQYKESTINNLTNGTVYDISNALKDCYILREFYCPKCKHNIIQIYKKENELVWKIYQSEDNDILVGSDISKRLRKSTLTDKKLISELTTATKLGSQGYHIAGYTYIRRAFEKFLDMQFEANKDEMAELSNYKKLIADGKKFDAVPTRDRVSLLLEIGALPPLGKSKQESTNKYSELYKILSKVIHNLSEETASQYAKIILSVLLFTIEQAERDKALKKDVSAISTIFNEVINTQKKEAK